MKVFVSSVISKFEEYRQAAVDAISILDHEAIIAERFGASPNSPQTECISKIRDSDAVVLIMGERYGYIQESGLSATHEEFRFAKKTKDVLLFVQTNVNPCDRQREFIKEAQEWIGGTFSAQFNSPDSLKNEIIRAIRGLERGLVSGDVDYEELTNKADRKFIELENYRISSPVLKLSMIVEPTDTLIRASEIEKPTFSRSMEQQLFFGAAPVFSTCNSTNHECTHDSIRFWQSDGRAFELWQDCSMAVNLPIKDENGFGSTIVEQEVIENTNLSLSLFYNILEYVDKNRTMSSLLIRSTLGNVGYASWQSSSDTSNGGTISLSYGNDMSPVAPRSTLIGRRLLDNERGAIAEDIVAMLRRQIKGR